eukprot:c13844_g1_i1 orf=1427-1876(-)
MLLFLAFHNAAIHTPLINYQQKQKISECCLTLPNKIMCAESLTCPKTDSLLLITLQKPLVVGLAQKMWMLVSLLVLHQGQRLEISVLNFILSPIGNDPDNTLQFHRLTDGKGVPCHVLKHLLCHQSIGSALLHLIFNEMCQLSFLASSL